MIKLMKNIIIIVAVLYRIEKKQKMTEIQLYQF